MDNTATIRAIADSIDGTSTSNYITISEHALKLLLKYAIYDLLESSSISTEDVVWHPQYSKMLINEARMRTRYSSADDFRKVIDKNTGEALGYKYNIVSDAEFAELADSGNKDTVLAIARDFLASKPGVKKPVEEIASYIQRIASAMKSQLYGETDTVVDINSIYLHGGDDIELTREQRDNIKQQFMGALDPRNHHRFDTKWTDDLNKLVAQLNSLGLSHVVIQLENAIPDILQSMIEKGQTIPEGWVDEFTQVLHKIKKNNVRMLSPDYKDPDPF